MGECFCVVQPWSFKCTWAQQHYRISCWINTLTITKIFMDHSKPAIWLTFEENAFSFIWGCCTDKQSWLCNCCSSLSFAAEASECSSDFWRWQESATGGGLSAPGAAGVSTELCDWCNNRQLPSSASFHHHRVGKVCEEHCSKVCTNLCFSLENQWRLCFNNLL